jgi:hypothetical protein
MQPHRLIQLCPTLSDRGGHEFDYTRAMANTAIAAGIESTVIFPTGNFKPELAGQSEPLLPALNRPGNRIFNFLKRFFLYRRIFRNHGHVGNLWFVHSAPPKELGLITLAWLSVMAKEQLLFLFLRHEMDWSFAQTLLFLLFRFATSAHVRYVTDSDELAVDYSARLQASVAVLPIPVTPLPLMARDPAHPLFGYFGARRTAKGFTTLPALIETTRRLYPAARFVIQTYRHRDDPPNPALDTALAQLRQWPEVRLIENALDSDAFAQELAACDAIFLPYDAKTYAKSTSGIFTAAVVARAVIIFTQDSWMGQQAEHHKLSRAVLIPQNPLPQQIEVALSAAIKKLQQPDIPSDTEQCWLAAQSGAGVLQQLVSIAAKN